MAMNNTGLRFKVQGLSKRKFLTPYNLPLTTGSRGFALLIAIIFMTVMLTLGLSLGSLGYKQTLLSTSAVESQYAFYAADAALECTLYADQQKSAFDFASHGPGVNGHPALLMCDTTAATEIGNGYSYNLGQGIMIQPQRVPLDSDTHCADVTIYKYAVPNANGFTTYIFSQGYNVPCSVVKNPGSTRFVSRGIKSSY